MSMPTCTSNAGRRRGRPGRLAEQLLIYSLAGSYELGERECKSADPPARKSLVALGWKRQSDRGSVTL
jgi:hypothetical protein